MSSMTSVTLMSSGIFAALTRSRTSTPLMGLLACLFALSPLGCTTDANVSGVWREVTLEPMSADDDALMKREIYELNLGQFGDRVTGVSVRYRVPTQEGLAPFDRGDRCECAFIIQGLIERLEEDEASQEESLFFVAQGLTFSLYAPEVHNQSLERTAEEVARETIGEMTGATTEEVAGDVNMTGSGMRDVQERSCPALPTECRRIFDLELVEGGDALLGETWCLDRTTSSSQDSRVSVRFEKINGVVTDSCESL